MGESHSDTLLHDISFLLKLVGLTLWIYLCSRGGPGAGTVGVSSPNQEVVVNGTVRIDGSSSIGSTDEDFICATMDWWPPTKCDYGTCSWGNSSILNLDLSNKILLNAIQAFSPLKIRIGGTLQDKVIYQTRDDTTPCTPFISNGSQMFGFTQGCLPMSRWDDLNRFFKRARAKVVFGLNALNGRAIASDGTCKGAWNSTNAQSLIRHTLSNGFTIHGWELGNEVSGHGIGASVAADQYAADMITLQEVVQEIYKGVETRPLVLGPGGFFDHDWFSKFVNATSNVVQVVTHHIYNLGPGVDDHLVEKILDPSYLVGGSQPFRELQNILKSERTSTVAWVGEAGGAYNSGRHLVTNSFVFSFWYLDQLGMASAYDTKTYCRQSLIGGNYGLLNTTTYAPNPDYYSALLWHRLMGQKVLSASFNGTSKVRAYAHCAKNKLGITLLLINLDSRMTVQVGILMENSSGFERDGGKYRWVRQEYHLTAKDGDLHSQTMLLNGQTLGVSSGKIPALEPKRVDPSKPIKVAPFSVVFAHIPSIDVPACR